MGRTSFSAAFCVLGSVALPTSADAAIYSYTYESDPDPACAVEVIGGFAECSVIGSFELDSAEFGTPQFALNADFQLFVDGSLFDEYSHALFALPGIEYCTEFCNEVVADGDGNVVSLEFFAVPSYSLGIVFSLDEAGSWEWSIFDPGNGLFSGGTTGTFTKIGPQPVPIHVGAVGYGAALLIAGAGLAKRRRKPA